MISVTCTYWTPSLALYEESTELLEFNCLREAFTYIRLKFEHGYNRSFTIKGRTLYNKKEVDLNQWSCW